MKKIIRIVLLAMSIMMFQFNVLETYAGTDKETGGLNEVQDMPDEVLEAMRLQEKALDAYQCIWDNFKKNESGEIIYPEEYAGEYISGENLVIKLTDCSEVVKQKYYEWSNYSEAIVFEKATYSLDYLNSIEEYADLLSQEYNIISYGVDRVKNNFVISVAVQDYDSLYNCIERGKSEYPILLETSDPASTAAALYGGDKLTNSKNGSCSVGIGGTYNGKSAILTCGHDNEYSPTFYYNGTEIGKVVYCRCNTSFGDISVNSLGDFSIVELTGNDTASNKVRNATSTVSISGTYSSVPVGTTIYKYGFKTGYAWGTVQFVNMTVNYDKYQVRGLYQSKVENASKTDAIGKGDSGGPVYILDGTKYKIHGTISGGVMPDSGISSIMYSSPIYYAIDAGFTVKTN